jgi:hypothetical protein
MCCCEPYKAGGQANNAIIQARAYGGDDELVLFTGEMVFPWMFEDIAALRPMKGVAELLAQSEAYTKLYDVQQLKRNEVPVAAATYVEVFPYACAGIAVPPQSSEVLTRGEMATNTAAR